MAQHKAQITYDEFLTKMFNCILLQPLHRVSSFQEIHRVEEQAEDILQRQSEKFKSGIFCKAMSLKENCLIQKYICTPVFSAALFTIVKYGSNPGAHQQTSG